MSAPVPLEIANVVTHEINEYLVTVERFLPFEDAKSVEWHDKITALKNDDHQWDKALCSASLAQLNGNVFAFESAIVDARKAGAPRERMVP